MKNLLRTTVLAAVACNVLLGGSAFANGRQPASLLLFPEFDHSTGHNTMITVTNTNRDLSSGTVRLHYAYISGIVSTLCIESDRFETLTAGDTLTVLTSAHASGAVKGYLYIYAVNAQGLAISFNHLIGDAVQMSGTLSIQHAVVPFAFSALANQGGLTDTDGDGIRDLNGIEYEQAPERILIPRFMGQSATHTSELVFIGLTGGKAFTTILDFLLFNDNEDVYSAQYTFRCWIKVPVTTVSAAFANSFLHDDTPDNPGEIIGATAFEAGWLLIDGNIAYSSNTQFLDPAVIAYLYERTGADNRFGAEIPFTQGLQANGDLLPVSPLGDSN